MLAKVSLMLENGLFLKLSLQGYLLKYIGVIDDNTSFEIVVKA